MFLLNAWIECSSSVVIWNAFHLFWEFGISSAFSCIVLVADKSFLCIYLGNKMYHDFFQPVDFQSTQLLLWRKYEIGIIHSTTDICFVNIKYILYRSISMPFYKYNDFLVWFPNHSEIFLKISSTTNSVSVALTMPITHWVLQCCEQSRRSWFIITVMVLAGKQGLWDTSWFHKC